MAKEDFPGYIPSARWTPEDSIEVSVVGIPFMCDVEINYLRHPEGNRIALTASALLDLISGLPTDAVIVIPTHATEAESEVKLSFAADQVILEQQMRDLIIEGKVLHTTKKEYDLLCFFMSSPNQVFSVGQVFNNVWEVMHQGEVDEVGTVRNGIAIARRKLGKYSYLLKTKIGFGYYLSEEKPEEEQKA